MIRELLTRLIVPRHMRQVPATSRDLKQQMQRIEALAIQLVDEVQHRIEQNETSLCALGEALQSHVSRHDVEICEDPVDGGPSEIYHFATSRSGKIHRIRAGGLYQTSANPPLFEIVCTCGSRLPRVLPDRLCAGLVRDDSTYDLCRNCFKE